MNYNADLKSIFFLKSFSQNEATNKADIKINEVQELRIKSQSRAPFVLSFDGASTSKINISAILFRKIIK